MTFNTTRANVRSILARRSIVAASIPLITLVSLTAHADFDDLIGDPTLNLRGTYNEIRYQSAIANQAVYRQLRANGCADDQVGPTATCNGGKFLVWRNVREVVHTANIASNARNPTGVQKPTRFHLRRNVGRLGGALQWCNGEEFASLNSLSTGFVSTQASNLSSRLTALRVGTNLRAANYGLDDNNSLLADQSPRRGGGASADATDSPWSVWGMFGNGSYLKGRKDAKAPTDITANEEGFEFDGWSANIGFDKRFNENWVAGALVGYQKTSMDFRIFPANPPNATPSGNSELSGLSLMPYVMFQSDHWYFSVSVGYQNMGIDMDRFVDYGPGPADPTITTPVDPTTVKNATVGRTNAHANALSSFDTLGFSYRPFGALTIDTSVSLDYQRTVIGRLTEQDLNRNGFGLTVHGQTINSLEGIPELRMQYTFTPGFGVWTPYIDAQWHHQFKTESRNVTAVYSEVQDIVDSSAYFNIKTEELDPWYQVYTVGLSAVLRGSSAGKTHTSGGVQVYANFRRYEGLKNYTQSVYSAGLRYEF